MGSIAFDFLADSIFFHDQSIENGFANETDQRIKRELTSYRNHILKHYDTLVQEIQDRDSFLKVFSTKGDVSVNLLKQTALYIDQFIIRDPIFSLTDIDKQNVKLMSKHFGYKENTLDRAGLVKSAKLLKDILPMVAGNYIKLFPVSYYFEGPKSIPIKYSENLFNDVLPEQIMKFFWENAKVSSMEKRPDGEGWTIIEGKLFLSRGIVVDFKGSNLMDSRIYHLQQMEVLNTDENEGTMKVRYTLPDTPPDEAEFKAWVSQSINQSSKAFFDKVYTENHLAAGLNSTYLCTNEFTGKLLSAHFNAEKTIQTYTADQMLNFDLPFLANIDIEKLMTIRELDADVFTNFRLELEKQFRELRTLTDPDLIQLKIENIFHELNDVQVQRIKQKVEHLRTQQGLNTLIAGGGLAFGMQTAGWSLLGTALAAVKGYKDYRDYREKVKENPAYLLWKIKK